MLKELHSPWSLVWLSLHQAGWFVGAVIIRVLLAPPRQTAKRSPMMTLGIILPRPPWPSTASDARTRTAHLPILHHPGPKIREVPEISQWDPSIRHSHYQRFTYNTNIDTQDCSTQLYISTVSWSIYQSSVCPDQTLQSLTPKRF